jgi:ElaB/YqjD/DUF883 family membrane-anchored ribosome-binding protein
MDDNTIEGAIKEGVGRVQDAYGGATGDLGVQAKGKLNEAAGVAQRIYGDTVDQARELANTASDFVAERPYAAMGVAALLGLVVGLLLGSAGGRTVYLRD